MLDTISIEKKTLKFLIIHNWTEPTLLIKIFQMTWINFHLRSLFVETARANDFLHFNIVPDVLYVEKSTTTTMTMIL